MASSVGRNRALKNLTNFTRQLHVLIVSGTPLVQALGALERQSKDLHFKAVRRRRSPCGSKRASRCPRRCARHPQYFDDVCRSLISAGEAGGKIDAMLDRLAKLTRSEAHVRSQRQRRDGLPVAADRDLRSA